MEKIKNRVDWADISKGIGILLVVFAHLQIPGIILKFIFSFHMRFSCLSAVIFLNLKSYPAM